MHPLSPHLLAAAVLAFANDVCGQCANPWVAGSGLPTTDVVGVGELVVWDPDGAGPQPEVLVAGGSFTIAGPVPIQNLAIRDLATGAWSSFPGWNHGQVTALAVTAAGELVAAGWGPGNAVVARWTGAAWTVFGTPNERVFALCGASSGDLFAGGAFTGLGGQLMLGVGRWDGSQWHPLGTGLGGFAFATALVEAGNHELIVGGVFSIPGGVVAPGIARWNGAVWLAMPGFAGQVHALAVAPNGDVLAGGANTNGIARWNGASWTMLGSSPWFQGQFATGALLALPDGDVLAGGWFTLAPAPNPVLRWNGTTWTPVAAGLTHLYPTNSSVVSCLQPLPNGDVVVGGEFAFAGGLPSSGVAVLTTTCAATSTSFGASCVSSGGSNTLTADLPWAGSDWRAHGSGLPAPAFVFAVTGLSPTMVPLASYLPAGVPGCALLAQPDLVQLVVSTNGLAEAGWTIPATPAVAGTWFRHQMVSLEFTPSLTIVASTATNALDLVVGFF